MRLPEWARGSKAFVRRQLSKYGVDWGRGEEEEEAHKKKLRADAAGDAIEAHHFDNDSKDQFQELVRMCAPLPLLHDLLVALRAHGPREHPHTLMVLREKVKNDEQYAVFIKFFVADYLVWRSNYVTANVLLQELGDLRRNWRAHVMRILEAAEPRGIVGMALHAVSEVYSATDEIYKAHSRYVEDSDDDADAVMQQKALTFSFKHGFEFVNRCASARMFKPQAFAQWLAQPSESESEEDDEDEDE